MIENSPPNRYAAYFDVEWEPPESKLRNTLLLPVPGDDYGRVLDKGELRLRRGTDGRFIIRCHEHVFFRPHRTLDTLLTTAAERCGSDDLVFIADSLRSGGNFGGLSALNSELARKRVALRKKRMPETSCVAALWNPTISGSTFALKAIEAAAKGLAIRLRILEVHGADELEGSFQAATREHARALTPAADSFSRPGNDASVSLRRKLGRPRYTVQTIMWRLVA